MKAEREREPKDDSWVLDLSNWKGGGGKDWALGQLYGRKTTTSMDRNTF